MAWVCVRCSRKIYAPRIDVIRPKFGIRWKYVKKRNELTCDVKNLESVKEGHVITHLHCIDGEIPGFKGRMREVLGIPENRDHPLLI